MSYFTFRTVHIMPSTSGGYVYRLSEHRAHWLFTTIDYDVALVTTMEEANKWLSRTEDLP